MKINRDDPKMEMIAILGAEIGVLKADMASLKEDAEMFRWLLNGNGYFMEEAGLCGHGPCDEAEKDYSRNEIHKAMKEEEDERRNG